MYLHRKTCFEALDVEQALLTSPRGFGAIHSILENSKLVDNLASCYLKSSHEEFEYISLEALLVLLDSNDPLLVSDREHY